MSFGMVAASYLGIVSTPTPVLAVAFNEGSGNTFNPTISPGTGIITPGYGQWIAGPISGTALGRYATGPSGYDDPCATLGGLAPLGTASWSSMTVMAWVKLYDDSYERRPLTLVNGTTVDDTWMVWKMTQNTGKLTSYLAGISVQSTEDVASEEWNHFCTVWDGTAQHLYVNGGLMASIAMTGPLYNTTAIFLGSALYNYGAQGVDDLRIYDQALTEAQIVTLMSVPVA